MELLIEIILELILEGSIEIIKIKKVPKFIRYFLAALITLFFAIIIFGILALGIISIKENILVGIFIILIGLLFLIGGIIKARKCYKDYNL